MVKNFVSRLLIISISLTLMLTLRQEVLMPALAAPNVEVHTCTGEDEAPNANFPLHMPFQYGEVWHPGGDGSFYGDGYHKNPYHDYYATDWNKGANMTDSLDDLGEEVLPVADGVVVAVAQNELEALGWSITIDHGSNIVTTYGHLQYQPTLKPGDRVNHWTIIGYVGDTGPNSQGAHLHLRFRVDGESTKKELPNYPTQSPKPSPMQMLNDEGAPWDETRELCDDAQNGPYISANQPGVTSFENRNYTGRFITAQLENVVYDFLDLNNQISSIYIPYGWSAVVWMHDGGTGPSKTFYTSDEDFSDDLFDDGVTPLIGNVSSMQIWFSSQCSSALSDQYYGSLTAFEGCTPPPTPTGSLTPTPSDTLPPDITLGISCPLGNNNWCVGAAIVSLTAVDNPGGTGIASVECRINGGSWEFSNSPIVFDVEGIYFLECRAYDRAGNQSAIASSQIKIDWTPPATTCDVTGPRDINGIFRDTVDVTCNVSDNLSGKDYTEYSFDDGATWQRLEGTNHSFVIDGNGVTRFLYRSVDLAGNSEELKDSGSIIINKYLIFSNSADCGLRLLSNTKLKLTGDLHTNGCAMVIYNTGAYITGTVSTVSDTNSISGNVNTSIQQMTTGVASVTMLDYPLSFYEHLPNVVVVPSDFYLDDVNTVISGTYYIKGDLILRTTTISGTVTFVIEGDVIDESTNGAFHTLDPHNGVVMFAGGNNMSLNSTGSLAVGLFYAPHGTIYARVTNSDFQGSMVGDQVELNGTTTFTMTYNAAFESGTYPLPLTTIAFAPSPVDLPPTPGTPSFTSPMNGASTQSLVGLIWGKSPWALVYRVQVATSPTFEVGTIVVDVSRLGTYHQANLLPNTQYWWRIQAINQAGTSAWSSIASFTTNAPTPTPTPTVTSTPTRTSTKTSTPTLAATATRTPTSSRTPTSTTIPTFTWTPTPTRTATATSVPTATRTPTPPPSPILAAPANNSTTASCRPLFDWSDVLSVTGYGIQIATSPTFSASTVTDVTVIESYYIPTQDLLPNTRYYWRVKSLNGTASSPWSGYWTVTIGVSPPVLLSPADGSVVGSLRPSFTWQAATGASYYQIQMALDNQFVNRVIDYQLAGTSYTPTVNLQAGQTYFWRVRARGTYAGYVEWWSPTWLFATP